ncbi:MAG: ribosomal protein S18-alanine N-acetyltransferase [Chloroflexota bacterium]
MNLDGCPYRISAMRTDDVATVVAIEQAVFAMPWSASAYRYEITQNEASEYLVLRHQPLHAHEGRRSLWEATRALLQPHRTDEALLGYGGFWFVIDEAHITTLAVRAAWRGRGLGELLLLSLIERAVVRGAEVATLEVRVSNAAAQSLYAKYGFERVGRRRGYYSDNREDAYIMTLEQMATPAYQEHLAGLAEALRQRLLAQGDPGPESVARQLAPHPRARLGA